MELQREGLDRADEVRLHALGRSGDAHLREPPEKLFEGDHTIVILIRVVDQMVSCCFERIAVFGVEKLDQLFEERESLNLGIAKALDEASAPWGIRVFRYEIANIINYINQAWGNDYGVVKVTDIKVELENCLKTQ